jgi:hypothetical protein
MHILDTIGHDDHPLFVSIINSYKNLIEKVLSLINNRMTSDW